MTAAVMENSPSENSSIKTVTEERIDESGRRVRITRKIRMRLVTEEVSPEVAARRNWKKFGASANDKPGPDVATTIIGEPVFLKLSLGKDIDRELTNNKVAAPVEAKQITCRFCSGAHWSAKCPFKDTFADETSGDTSSSASAAPVKSAYVPPSMRNRTDASQQSPGTSAPVQRDQTNTIRMTNLSDIVTEADVRDLCGRIGPVARVYMARDQVTGRCRGFAFVTFHSFADAEKAVTRLNGHLYGNVVLHAEWAAQQTS